VIRNLGRHFINTVPQIPPSYESGVGQSATSRFVRAESALASTPDIGEPDCYVSVLPKAAVSKRSEAALFDHLVGARDVGQDIGRTFIAGD
jgi:hypothetical protein